MGMKKGLSLLWVSCGLFIVVVSLYGFINLRGRAGLPPSYRPESILRIDTFDIRNGRDVEFVLSGKRIGDPVEITLKAAGGREAVQTRLVAYYSQAPLAFLVIAGIGFLIGFLVFALRSEDRRARIFYCATLAFSSSVLVSGDVYGVHDHGLSLLPGVLFNFAYPLAPALLWRFTRTFAVRREKAWTYSLWAVPVIFGALLNAGFLYSQLKPSFEAFRLSVRFYPVFRAYVAVACIAAVVELVRSFRASASDDVRTQIKLIFFGMTAGLSPFVFLYQIPQVLGLKPVLSEDLSSVFLVLVPAFLAVAILKFRLLDINLVINRSLVYSLLTMFTVGVYLLAVEILARLFAWGEPRRAGWISLGAAVLAAVVFEPGRKRIQALVDRTFFRQDYDYRKAVLSFNGRAQRITSAEHLISQFTGAVSEGLPIDRIGLAVCEPAREGPKFIYRQGISEQAGLALLSLEPNPVNVWAREAAVRTTQGMDFSAQDLLASMDWDVAVPLPFEPETMTGCLALGRKKSGQGYTAEDIDLVKTLAGELALGLRRIRLQEEIIYERATREKADELSRLKTEFISSVSHELRTPMSSLQGLSELLGSGKVTEEARRERLLQLMAGECGRLSRFLQNVLDFGRIEKETKLYDRRTVPLQPIIQEIVDLCRSGVAAEECVLRAEMPAEPVLLEADQDAVRQALLNLLDNAIKYSEGRKEVTVRLVQAGEHVEIQVEDHGMGIEPQDRDKIFEAFFRSPEAVRHNPKGVGLGLKIVKHIMDAHGGRVGLRSVPGRGSTFSLIFPARGSA
jgi:signal transduction histidine kinase